MHCTYGAWQLHLLFQHTTFLVPLLPHADELFFYARISTNAFPESRLLVTLYNGEI